MDVDRFDELDAVCRCLDLTLIELKPDFWVLLDFTTNEMEACGCEDCISEALACLALEKATGGASAPLRPIAGKEPEPAVCADDV